jgi:hypothetical protein
VISASSITVAHGHEHTIRCRGRNEDQARTAAASGMALGAGFRQWLVTIIDLRFRIGPDRWRAGWRRYWLRTSSATAA